MRKRLALLTWLLIISTRVFGDLIFPASFEIVETTPEQFSMTLTLPVVSNRVLEVRPLLPDVIVLKGEPITHTGAGSIKRTWQAQVDPAVLAGSTIGLEGLLGSDLEVRFLLRTLDGRRHEQTMKPTHPFFVNPTPPPLKELAASAGREGVRGGTRHLGFWFLLAGLLVITASWRRSIRTATLLAAILFAPLLAHLAGSLMLPMAGLSDAETRLATGFLFAGWIVVGGLMAAFLGSVDALLSGRPKHRIHQLTGILASAWLCYQTAGWITRHGPGLWISLQRLLNRFAYGWFAPFASDWAMARLRIPWLSMALVIAGFWILRRRPRHRLRRAGAGAVIGLAVLLLPWGVTRTPLPFLSLNAPAPSQARRILTPMLTRIYNALDLEDEVQAYDRLSEEVAGELITDLYLDSRRRLIVGTREGAVVEVLDVDVVEVGAPRSMDDGPQIFAYPCRWTVTAKITHWQHSHERRNLYAGDLGLTVDSNRWKLAEIELQSEEREVVPGSFSSR